jgi:hypothetical protein
VRFVSYAGGNYALAANSPYMHAATHGTAIGANDPRDPPRKRQRRLEPPLSFIMPHQKPRSTPQRRGHFAAALRELGHDLFLKPDVHRCRVRGVTRVTQFLRQRNAILQARVESK